MKELIAVGQVHLGKPIPLSRRDRLLFILEEKFLF